MTGKQLRFLHCHADFSQGEVQRDCARLMNAIGRQIDHVVISDEAGATGAREWIDKTVTARFPTSFPQIAGRPSPGRLAKLAEALKGYDLICTYGWGAINVALAHTLFAESMSLPPLVHHENGIDPNCTSERKIGRNWFRRIALGRAAALIVDTELMEKVALNKWQQPRARVQRIRPGLTKSAFKPKPDPKALRLVKRDGELWVGKLSEMKSDERVPSLIEAFGELDEHWQLVILGNGPEEPAIRKAIAERDLEHRVHLPGTGVDPAKVLGLFEIFAIAGADGHYPRAAQRAAAAGLPIVAPASDEITSLLSADNRPYLVEPGDRAAFAKALKDLSDDAAARSDVGAANLEQVRETSSISAMAERYRSVYSAAMGREF